MCLSSFIKTHRPDNTQNESWCELWTLGIMRCQCRFIECDKCTAPVGMLVVGEAVCMGEGVGGNSCISVSFAVNFKVL